MLSNEKLYVDLNDKKKYGGQKIICRFEEKKWYVVLFVDLTNKKNYGGGMKKKVACRNYL